MLCIKLHKSSGRNPCREVTAIKSLLVIVPCHNEAISITATLDSIKQVVPHAAVWVIDNLSTDDTSEIAKKAGAVVYKEPQIGKGFAVRNAFARVNNKFDVIFMVDGDDTYGMENLITAIDLIVDQGYDLIVGTRVDSQSKSQKNGNPYRTGHKIGNVFISSLFRILFQVPISDSLSGWRVMSPGFVKSFLGGASGFEIETELNVHAYAIRASVTSVDVTYKERKEGSYSKLRTYSDGMKILSRQISLLRIERPYLFYTTVSSPWFVTSVILIASVLQNYFSIGIIPNFPSLIAGVGCFILGTLLVIAGLILDNVRQSKVVLARFAYSLTRDYK